MQFDLSSSEHDKMAALSYLEYLLQIERNPTAFCGRRVLAAVLMKSPDSSIRVLSLGTGKIRVHPIYKIETVIFIMSLILINFCNI